MSPASPPETDWRARAEHAERRATEAWEAYHRLAADRADAAYYRGLLEDLRGSLSWRITAPLRLAMALVRRVARLVERRRAR